MTLTDLLAGVVVPPATVDHPISRVGQLVVIVFTGIPALAALGFVPWFCRRQRSWWPAAVFVGGFLTVFAEPTYHSTFHCWFYDSPDAIVLFRDYGYAQPLWLWITYVWCWSAPTIWVWSRVDKGVTRRQMMKICGLFAAVYGVFEIVSLNVGVYEYWGQQPYRIAGYPAWILAGNMGIPVVAGVALAVLLPRLEGARRIAVVAVIPAAYALVEFSAFPGLAAINAADPSTFVLYLGCTIAVLLSLTVVWFAVLVMPTPQDRTSETEPAGVREQPVPS